MRQPDGISATGNFCSRPGPERTGPAFPSATASKTEREIWDMGKPVSPYKSPSQAHGEATSACCTASLGTKTNRGVAVTGSKS